jgi:hypothetical protein
MANRDKLDVQVMGDPLLDKVEIEQSVKLNKDDIITYLCSVEEQRLTGERDRISKEHDALTIELEEAMDSFGEAIADHINKTVGSPTVLKSLETFFGVPFEVSIVDGDDSNLLSDEHISWDHKRGKHLLAKEISFSVTLTPKTVRRRHSVDGEMQANREIPWTDKLKEQGQEVIKLKDQVEKKQKELLALNRLINDLPQATRQMRAAFVERALASTDSGQNLLSALKQITGARSQLSAENLAKQLTTRKR